MKSKTWLLVGCMILVNIVGVSALSLGVHVPEKYTDVIAGERLYFEIEIQYPENPLRKDLRFEYDILTESGDLVSQSKALKAVETQASFIDFIVIPRDVENGLYIINVKVKDYEDLSEEVSSSFHVRKLESDQIMIYLMIILGAVILVGILVVLSIVMKE